MAVQRWRTWSIDQGDAKREDWLLEENEELLEISETETETFVLTSDGLWSRQKSGSDLLPDQRVPSFGDVQGLALAPSFFQSKSNSSAESLLLLHDGKVLQSTTNDDIWIPISTSPSAEVTHGFRQVKAGSDHIVLLDNLCQVWSAGACVQAGKVHATEDEKTISRNEFFQGYSVALIAAGDDFSCAIVEKRERESVIVEEQDKSNNHKTSTCCPLGLPIADLSDGGQQNHRPVDDKTFSYHQQEKGCDSVKDHAQAVDNFEDRSSLSEGDDDLKTEKLAKSGLVLNPSDAFKFLSDQLSWIGIGVNKDVAQQAVSSRNSRTDENLSHFKPVEEVTVTDPKKIKDGDGTDSSAIGSSSMVRATSFVADGVKAMGENVISRFSKSFSTDKANDEEQISSFDDIATIDADASSLVELSILATKEESLSIKSENSTSLSMASRNSSSIWNRHPRQQFLNRGSHRRSASTGLCQPPNLDSSAHPLPDTSRTEVWTWGKGHRGQLGQGDMLDRLQPSVVSLLSGIGVIKIVCGKRHVLAMTNAGLAYGWGENSKGQASPSCALAVCSTPQLLKLPTGETARDIAASNNQSFVLTDSGSVYFCGTSSPESGRRKATVMSKVSFMEGSLVRSEQKMITKIMASASGLHGSVCDVSMPVTNLKALEKSFVQKLRQISKRVLLPLCQKDQASGNRNDSEKRAKDTAANSIERLTRLVEESIKSGWDLHTVDASSSHSLIQAPEVFSEALRSYSRAVCDCLVVDIIRAEKGTKISRAVLELLQSVCHVVQSEESGDMLQFLLLDPTYQLDQYISCLRSMVAAGRQSGSVSELSTCDRIERAIHVLKAANRDVELERKSLLKTKAFWDVAWTKFSSLKRPDRRIVLDSKEVPITVGNSNSLSKHWIILMNDVLVHAGYSSFTVHPLQTIWIRQSPSFATNALSATTSGNGSANGAVDGIGATKEQLEISLILPEDNLVLVAPDHERKNEWIVNLQRAIVNTLSRTRTEIGDKQKDLSTPTISTKHFSPPLTRVASYSFTRLAHLKNAEYEGHWLQGKMHGSGRLSWPEGRSYSGQWRHGERHGIGKYITVDSQGGQTIHEGQWKNDKFEGHGVIRYPKGDVYTGCIKDGKPQGHGCLKQGRFMSTGASVFLGDWSGGVRCGYGVLDDILTGEKYMGMWSGDMKSGPGCVVTLDGVYYEGTFSHNKMSGPGLMIFEDDAVYEGNFADAGVFSGTGTLSYANGDRLVGSFYGNYTDGMKFNGTIHKCVRSPSGPSPVHHHHHESVDGAAAEKSKLIGKYCVPAELKWDSVFRYHQEVLGIQPDLRLDSQAPQSVWEQVAIAINQNKNNKRIKGAGGSLSAGKSFSTLESPGNSSSLTNLLEGIETIPDYYNTGELTSAYLTDAADYLTKAFTSPLHPLSHLMESICDCFTATYGGVRIHPRLLRHAVDELRAIVERLYRVTRVLFPALPAENHHAVVPTENDPNKVEIVTTSSWIFPHILPKVHPAIFMLYALHYKKEDDEYWARLMKWNRHPDFALLSFLGVDPKFWQSEASPSSRSFTATSKDCHFTKAIETLQRLKTTFTPVEKLDVMLDTFREVNEIGQDTCGPQHIWSMDDLFPVFQYLVVRARILQLGAEIHMIEDLMEQHHFNGEYGIAFTTLQASYYQILRETLSIY